MLRDAVDHVEDLTSRLRLDYRARQRGAVVVEGPEDELVVCRAFRIDSRDIFPAAGRVNVIRVAGTVLSEEWRGVVCLADRDFAPVPPELVAAQILVLYDGADLESMLFETSIMERFTLEWSTARKLAAAGGAAAVRLDILGELRPLAALRSANEQQRWGLDFSLVALMDVTDKATMTLLLPRVLGRLRAQRPDLANELRGAAEQTPPVCPDTGRVLVRGRDAMEMLAVGLRSRLGNLSRQQVADEFAARIVRSMVGAGDLDSTPFAARFTSARAARQTAA